MNDEPGGTTGDTGRGGLRFGYGRVGLGRLHGSSVIGSLCDGVYP